MMGHSPTRADSSEDRAHNYQAITMFSQVTSEAATITAHQGEMVAEYNRLGQELDQVK